MVMLVLSVNQNDWVLEMNCKKVVSDVVHKRVSELEVIARICGPKWHTPSWGCHEAPPDFSPLNV
jgi:hypothetical protein